MEEFEDLLSEGDSFYEFPKKSGKKASPKKATKNMAEILGLDLDNITEATPKTPTSAKKDTIFGLDLDNKSEVVPTTPKSTKKDNIFGLETTSAASTHGNIDKLFDLDLDTKLETIATSTSARKDTDWLGLGGKKDEKDISTGTKSSKSNIKVSFDTDDVDDLLEKTLSEAKVLSSKKSFLSEILGETKQDEKTLSFDDILQSGSARKKEPAAASQVAESKSVPLISNPAPSTKEFVPSAGTTRRGKRNVPASLDPLGLLDVKSESVKEESVVKLESQPSTKVSNDSLLSSVPKSGDVPNWLGTVTSQQSKESLPEVRKSLEQTPQPTTRSEVDGKSFLITDNMLESLLTQQKIASSHMELQNASLSLQQQESQLMIALQLKKYEENLAEMQRKQQEMIAKQDLQFNSLLERQFAKQQIMENNMRVQQERINNHIQLLLSQPSGGLQLSQDQQQKNDYIKQVFEENKKFYDDIVVSLKQKHQEEIFILEESYKKQLKFLEDSLESTEFRLKTEIDNINRHYSDKIIDLTKQKEDLIIMYEEKLKKLHEQNLSEIETIKENCKITVADVRNEYKQMMDDVMRSKQKELETVAETEVITKKLDESLDVLQNSSKAINELQNNINAEKKLLSDVQAETLSAKEQEIKMMKESLEKQRRLSDSERSQLLALVNTLESRVAEQVQAAREEHWVLQQAVATLAARSQAFDRETDFTRKNLEREREQIKVMKEQLLAENEKMILQLTEEKLAIAAEKSRIETTVKLNQNFDAVKSKAEIEAALKVAKEATELTDKERENLCQQQCELEILKRNILDREKKLSIKEQELEKLFSSADLKYREGQKALTEAKLTEHKYAERLKDIQKQLVSLAAREKKLTEDKILLSKERVALHNQIKDNKKCGLCEATTKNNFNNIRPEVPVWAPDAEILRLKHDLENEYISRENSLKETRTNV